MVNIWGGEMIKMRSGKVATKESEFNDTYQMAATSIAIH